MTVKMLAVSATTRLPSPAWTSAKTERNLSSGDRSAVATASAMGPPFVLGCRPAAEPMHHLDQADGIFGVGGRKDPVTQVEDVSARPRPVEDTADPALDLGPVGEEGAGVEVAL